MTIARDGGDDAVSGADTADAVVAAIGNIEVARPVQGYREGIVQAGLCRRPSITAEPTLAIAGVGRNQPGPGIHSADAMVAGIGDKEIAAAIHRHIEGHFESRFGGRAPVTAEARSAAARHRGDLAGLGIDPPDPAAALLDEIEVALSIESHTHGGGQAGFGGGHIIVAIAELPVAGHGGHHTALAVNAEDPMGVAVRQVEVVGSIQGNADRSAQVHLPPGSRIDGSPFQLDGQDAGRIQTQDPVLDVVADDQRSIGPNGYRAGGECRGVFGQYAGGEHGPAQQEKKKAHDRTPSSFQVALM